MSDSAERQWSRKWLGVTVAVLVALPLAAFGIWKWMINDSADPVSTTEAVAEFRSASTLVVTTVAVPTTIPASVDTATTVAATVATTVAPMVSTSTTAPPQPPVELPEPGVYRYATTGFEEIDALGGARHDYPAETTITVTLDGCGVRLRWDALRQRREEWRLCVADQSVVVQPDSVQYHEFFDQGEEEPVDCDVGVAVVSAEPSDVVAQDCFRVDEAWLPVWEVVGTETRTVDGVEVDVVHVRQQVTDEDDYWEYLTIDWYLAPDGLPVEVTNLKSSNSPTFIGDVVYDEQYRLELLSFEPLT